MKFFASFYIFWLAASAMGVFILGAFVAPVIFHSEVILGVQLLGRFEAGQLMSEIFARFNYILLVTAALIVAYEGFLAVNKKNSITMLILSSVNILCILIFALILTPRIIAFQAQGAAAIKSQTFATLHDFAELDFKILLATLVVSCFIRMSSVICEKLILSESHHNA